MSKAIHNKLIKPSACQATHYNGTRNKSITSSLARRGLKLIPLAIGAAGVVSLIGVVSSNTYADNRNLLFTVNATTPSLEISVPSSVTLNITPSSSGTFGYADINVQAGSSSSDGYKIMMYTTSATNPTNLVGTKGSVIETLPDNNNGNGYTQSEFIVNKWGYKWSFNGNAETDEELHNPKINYYPILDNAHNGNALTVTKENSNAETTTVTLATKLDNETPADSYSTILSFVILANSSTDTSTFDAAFYANGKTTYTYQDATGATVNTGLYAMQDMNVYDKTTSKNTICDTVPTPTTTTEAPETRLIDKRDNKVYWVAKLKDGNCWMTQGLDLDLDSSTALTSDNTDLNKYKLEGSETNFDGCTYSGGVISWTPASTANTTVTLLDNIVSCSSQNSAGTGCEGQTNAGFAPSWTNDNDIPYSANPGDRYIAPTYATGTYASYYELQDKFYNSLASCNSNIDSVHFNGDCTHYKLGNYYNFAAANATNDVSGAVASVVDGTEMPNSICPVNWRLPKGITGPVTNGVDSSNNSDFDTLLYKYGIVTGPGVESRQPIYWNNELNTTTVKSIGIAGLNSIRNTPLYFVRSGDIHGGALRYAGVDGISWTSTTSVTGTGYYFSFRSHVVYPTFNAGRFYGFPVRCIAR